MAGKGGGSKEGRAASRCKVLAWQAPCQSNSNPPVQPVRVQVDNISGQTNTFPNIFISNCAHRVGIQGLVDECIPSYSIYYKSYNKSGKTQKFVKGCVIKNVTNATFDHVYLDIR